MGPLRTAGGQMGLYPALACGAVLVSNLHIYEL